MYIRSGSKLHKGIIKRILRGEKSSFKQKMHFVSKIPYSFYKLEIFFSSLNLYLKCCFELSKYLSLYNKKFCSCTLYFHHQVFKNSPSWNMMYREGLPEIYSIWLFFIVWKDPKKKKTCSLFNIHALIPMLNFSQSQCALILTRTMQDALHKDEMVATASLPPRQSWSYLIHPEIRIESLVRLSLKLNFCSIHL